MEALGARRERIVAAIGPCIAQASYEVDGGFRARLLAAAGGNGRFLVPGRPGHWQFDLEGYCLSRLAAAGITNAAGLHADRQVRADIERRYGAL